MFLFYLIIVLFKESFLLVYNFFFCMVLGFELSVFIIDLSKYFILELYF